MTARAIRTNNPFALIQLVPDPWRGLVRKEDDGFLVFENNYYGARAGYINLINTYFRRGLDTPAKITAVYAPASHGGNNPVAYASMIASALGISVNTPIERNKLLALGRIITQVERGVALDDNTLVRALEDAANTTGFPIKKKD